MTTTTTTTLHAAAIIIHLLLHPISFSFTPRTLRPSCRSRITKVTATFRPPNKLHEHCMVCLCSAVQHEIHT